MGYRYALFFVLLVLVPGILAAQPGDPGGDPDVPISGIEYLIGAGALFGVFKKLFAHRKKSSE